jgi:ribonuclease-3
MTQPLTQEALELTLGIPLTGENFHLYVQAFTHKSVATKSHPSYERLEFLGDSIISLCVARWLFESYPNEQEGVLTRVRTKLVSGACLSKLAKYLHLHRFIQMNERAMLMNWNHNNRILEDVFESLIGALYYSEGLVVARNFLLTLYSICVDFKELHKEENYKDQLMRYTQSKGISLPDYILKQTHAPCGDQTKPLFEISVTVEGKTGVGTGNTKKQAQQMAAYEALRSLGIPADF